MVSVKKKLRLEDVFAFHSPESVYPGVKSIDDAVAWFRKGRGFATKEQELGVIAVEFALDTCLRSDE